MTVRERATEFVKKYRKLADKYEFVIIGDLQDTNKEDALKVLGDEMISDEEKQANMDNYWNDMDTQIEEIAEYFGDN